MGSSVVYAIYHLVRGNNAGWSRYRNVPMPDLEIILGSQQSNNNGFLYRKI